MSIHSQPGGNAPSLRDRLNGVLLFLGCYGVAALVIVVCRGPFQQSLIWWALGPALLGFVWISTAVVLANLVLSRTQGKRRLAVGFAYAALILLIVCALLIETQSNLSNPSYQGP